MKITVLNIVLVFLFCITFSMNVFAQKNENVKSTGIKAGIIFPVGELSDNNSTGFMVADLSKWYLSGNVRLVGRMEVTFFGGKEITEVSYGYSYTHTTSPFGIITAGMGFEFIPDPNKSGLYGIIDFPSMNLLLGQGSVFKVGVGIGFGYEFSWGKSSFGLEARFNAYNALLTENSEASLKGLQLGLETAF